MNFCSNDCFASLSPECVSNENRENESDNNDGATAPNNIVEPNKSFRFDIDLVMWRWQLKRPCFKLRTELVRSFMSSSFSQAVQSTNVCMPLILFLSSN